MRKMILNRNRWYSIVIITIITILIMMLSGCTKIPIIADYDASTMQNIIRTEKLVDMLYKEMLESPEGERKYSKYSQKYVEIDAELLSLLKQNQIRPLNTDSTKICENTLKLWEKHQQEHKIEGTLSNQEIELNKGDFERLFYAMKIGENSKK